MTSVGQRGCRTADQLIPRVSFADQEAPDRLPRAKDRAPAYPSDIVDRGMCAPVLLCRLK